MIITNLPFWSLNGFFDEKYRQEFKLLQSCVLDKCLFARTVVNNEESFAIIVLFFEKQSLFFPCLRYKLRLFNSRLKRITGKTVFLLFANACIVLFFELLFFTLFRWNVATTFGRNQNLWIPARSCTVILNLVLRLGIHRCQGCNNILIRPCSKNWNLNKQKVIIFGFQNWKIFNLEKKTNSFAIF